MLNLLHDLAASLKNVYCLQSFIDCHQVDNESIVVLKEISVQLPDLIVLIDNNNDAWLASGSVNTVAEGFDLLHSYEECCNAPVVVYPWKKINGCKIYTLPYQFMIGHHNELGYGDLPDTNWNIQLELSHINQEVIDKISTYFKRHPPENK